MFKEENHSTEESSIQIPFHQDFILEKQLEDFVVVNFERIFGKEFLLPRDEKGKLWNQYHTDIGRIDILAREPKSNSYVVIELKASSRESDKAVSQVLRYMGWIEENLCKKGENVKGLIICGMRDKRLEYSLKKTRDISLKYFRLDFQLVEQEEFEGMKPALGKKDKPKQVSINDFIENLFNEGDFEGVAIDDIIQLGIYEGLVEEDISKTINKKIKTGILFEYEKGYLIPFEHHIQLMEKKFRKKKELEASIVEIYEELDSGEPVDISDIVERAVENGIPKDVAIREIDEKTRRGFFYEPETGYVRRP